MPDRSSFEAVVVSWNAAEHLKACLGSLSPQVARTVVVDNASSDHSVETARRIGADVVEAGSNLGFGRAANRGMALTTAPYVLIINPDAMIMAGSVAAMASVLDSTPDAAVVGPRIVTADGSPYPSARAFPSLMSSVGHGFVGLFSTRNRWSDAYLHPARPDWIAGTAMLVRRTAFEAVGGFDERYFMYVEDVDLCWRLAAAGWTVAVADDALVRHVVGASSEQRPYRMIVEHHRSLWRFACRSQRGIARAGLPLIAAGLVGRAGLSVLRRVVSRRSPALH